MGRNRTKQNAHLPPGVVARKRGENTYYYFVSRAASGDRKRTEISLGRHLANGMAELEKAKAPAEAPKRSFERIGWLSLDLFRACRATAKRRGIPFEVTHDHVDALLVESKGRCALSGIPFEIIKEPGARTRKWMPSIDRIESSGGYVDGNIRLVAAAVNVALSDIGTEALIRIARGIMRTQRGVRL